MEFGIHDGALWQISKEALVFIGRLHLVFHVRMVLDVSRHSI